MLVLEQQQPGALGNGRGTLRHKMHVVCHAARMVSTSWAQAAARTSSVFSWTGDLGTEAGVSCYYDSLMSLFGDWIVTDDERRSETGEEQGGEEQGEPTDEAIKYNGVKHLQVLQNRG